VNQAGQTVTGSSLTLKAPAKINLYLKVLSRRPDGYHDIESVMQKITLFDILSLTREGTAVSLTCPGSEIPENRENLVYRAAEIFFATAGIDPGVKIVLEKNIPVAAGLGGGSSDAATALLGLNRLFGVALGFERLLEIGLQLGADVPFFLYDYSAAVAGGIGEKLEKAGPIQEHWIVLVNPGFAVSTKWVYENFPLTSCSNPYILARGRKMVRDFHTVQPGLLEELGNDLETVTLNRYPEIGYIKKELKKAGAVTALMSGSGPTVFGLFTGKKEAQSSLAKFAKDYGDNVFLVRPYIP